MGQARPTRSRLALALLSLVAWLVIVGGGVPPVSAASIAAPAGQSQVASDATRLDNAVQQVDQLVASGNWAQARTTFRTFQESWLDVEDGFRDASRDGYARIEAAMVRVADALKPEPPDAAAVRNGLVDLRVELAPFARGTIAQGSPTSAAPTVDLPTAMAMLDKALAAAEQGDAVTAQGALHDFQTDWLSIEGAIKTRSAEIYRVTEDNMTQAAAMLQAKPPRTAEAAAVLKQMHDDLTPFVEQPAHYGIADAAIILLREGLEALLVVAALVAFLAKSGHNDKQVWIWGGAGAGVLVSMVGAFAFQRAFSAATAGANRELVEGVTGLVAAGMLLYVSYWLHSKANIGAWQRYVREKTSAALTGGSLASLATISFLAVFREGAETALFYLGIAPSIAPHDLAIGLGLGAGGLAIVAVLILMLGVQIPLRPFFMISSLLLYYLAFKFIGTGIHSLQVAGGLRATPAPIPSVDLIGLYPTWETTLPQLALLLVAIGVILWPRVRPPIGSQPATASHA
ncbi:MAG: high-affinity iron transporter [Chloroflexota bacterium]|nr:high-affinity iron transporter [Chloroflexota bacterium]